MSNIATTVIHDVERVLVDVVTFLPHAADVLASAVKNEPNVKAALIQLIEQASLVIADTGTAAISKGVNLAADAKTLADADAFFQFFIKSFVPAIEKAYGDIQAGI